MDANSEWTELEQVIDRAEAGGGTVGVTVIPPRGDAFAHHGARRFRAASTVKIPIMIELYRQIDRGERDLGDRYRLRNEDRAPGSGGRRAATSQRPRGSRARRGPARWHRRRR